MPPTSAVVAPAIRPARPADGAALWRLARSNGLDENSPYAYLLFGEYFSASTLVAVSPSGHGSGGDDGHGGRGDVVGFVMAFPAPGDPRRIFVWQIGVAESHRQQGIAASLLDELYARSGAAFVEATVTPSNTASRTLFDRFGARHGAPVEVEPLFGASLFPGDDHEAEDRFRIGPLPTVRNPQGN